MHLFWPNMRPRYCYCLISSHEGILTYVTASSLRSILLNLTKVKPVLRGHSKRRPKIGFQDRSSLNACQNYCRVLQGSILQYVRPSLSYHLSLRYFFLSIFEYRLRQVLLYYAEAKLLAHDSHIVRAKENHKFNHDGLRQRQA